MDAYLYIFAEHLRSTYLLAQEGLLEEEEWQRRVLIDSSYFFGNPYGQAWWRQFSVAPTSYPQDLINLINEEVGNNVGKTIGYFDGLLEHLAEITSADPAPEFPQ